MKILSTPPLSSKASVKVSKLVITMLLIAGSGYSQNTFPTNGNVGIGTLTPQFPLDVNGNARVTGNLLVGGGIITASVVNTSGPINAGDINVTNNLNITGNSILGGSLTISSMAGLDNFEVLVNPVGQLFKGSKKFVTACIPNAPAWFLGGNNVLGLINQPNPIIEYGDIGTCDNADFILKSNNTLRQWLKPDGTIGFGTNVGSNTGGPEYRFNAGVLRLQSMNSYGGPQVVFDGGQNLFGDWGIEYLASNITSAPGLNFWKPYGSYNSNNYLFFIGDDGKVAVGNVTNATSARFNVDAWSGDGIKSLTDASLKAYSVFDKTNNLEKFVVYGNGATHIGAVNAQIGFTNSAIQDGNTALNINNQNIDGIKFSTSNTAVRIISVMNTNTLTSVFSVKGNGQTSIGGEYNYNSTYMLAVNGKIGAREIKVSIQSPWPDFVFAKNYKLKSLEVKENYILKHKHLPDMPSAKELEGEELNLNLGEMQSKTIQQIEEIYLHLFEMKKELNVLRKENAELKKQLH